MIVEAAYWGETSGIDIHAGTTETMARLYAEDAVNHQVIRDPVVGRDAIKEMFAAEFSRADMVCLIENIFQDGDWAILEWKDPKGLRGCGFFQIVDDRIISQRGYSTNCPFFSNTVFRNRQSEPS